jgi:hypothetical protein
MKLYCENCGKQLQHIRKALPGRGIIIDLIRYHECSAEPVTFDVDLSSIIEAPSVDGKDKFVKLLNDLKAPDKKSEETTANGKSRSLRPSSMTGTNDLRDRRFESVEKPKSTAPSTIKDQIQNMLNSEPIHDLPSDKEEQVMGE